MHENAFKQAFDSLNPAQQKAVETIYGPVMVIAGPGTGKTQIIALRTANILLKTDVNPENILITTFTEAGVISIKKRLMELVGTVGSRVNVSTIHAFCNDVIQAYPERFLAYKAGRSIDDIEQIEIYEQILTENKFEFLSSDYDPLFYLQNARDRVGKLKQEGISVSDFREKITIEETRYAEELAEIDPKLKKYETTKEKNERHIGKLKDLAIVYEQYLTKCRELGVYDFADMIRFVLEEFRRDENLCYLLAERYQFIMIDEFQDTNNAQNEILERIVAPNDSRNILVVGDDDQSIYRFQGANLENMLHFSKKYEDATVLVLTDNYRSTQQILDLSSRVIENNETRIVRHVPGISKTLFAKKSREGKQEFLAFHNDIAEKAFVLSRVKKHLEANLPAEEFAVIVRTNREVEAWTDFFQNNTIPVESKLRANILSSRFVRLLLDLIRLIMAPHQNDAAAIHIMRSGLFEIDRVDILRFTRLLYKKNYTTKWKLSIFDYLSDETLFPVCHCEEGNDTAISGSSDGDNVSLHGKGQQTSFTIDPVSSTGGHTFSPEFTSFFAFSSFRDAILEMQARASELDCYSLFRHILDTSGFIRYVEKVGNFSDLEDIFTLLEQVKKWTQASSAFSLELFLKKISYYEKYNIAINRQILKSSTGGVQVLTAHQAKGLEYSIVCMPGLTMNSWEKKRVIDQLRLPSGIVGDGLTIETDASEEERRLFFVGVTRAKHELYLSFPMSVDGKSMLRSIFTQETEMEPIIVNDVDLSQVVANILARDVTLGETITFEEEQYIREFLSTYKLSATDLNKFLSDPLVFLRDTIFRYPFEENEYTIFGKTYHKALEIFYATFKNTGETPALSWLTSQFQVLLSREILPVELREKLLEKGVEGLTGWYNNHSKGFVLPIELEMNFYSRNILVDNIPLTGKIDKIEQMTYNSSNDFVSDRNLSDKIEILRQAQDDVVGKIPVALIDYKTGRTKSLNEIKGNTTNSEGNYLRQLLFYKIMFERDAELSRKYEVSDLAIEFVEGKDGKYAYISVDYTPEDIERVENEIRETWSKMNDMEFWRNLLKK